MSSDWMALIGLIVMAGAWVLLLLGAAYLIDYFRHRKNPHD